MTASLLHQAAQKAVEALTDARNEIQWWVNEHGCCMGHESRVIEKVHATLTALESALQQQPEPAGAPGATDAERAAWLADKIAAGGDYAKEAAAMLRRWPVIPAAPPECETEDEKTAFSFGYWQGLHAARKGQEVPREPVDMVLYCPDCGAQHIDAPELGGIDLDRPGRLWLNPPHRSHKCHGCDCIWRPADVATNGVAELKTRGKADTWVVRPGHMSGAFPVSDSTTRQQEVGSRWKLVPVEPTCEMIRAASVIRATMVDAGEWCVGIGGAIDAYEAMLAAAPSTPKKAEGVSGTSNDQQEQPR